MSIKREINIELDNRVVGFLTFYEECNDNQAIISFISVLSEYRGKGIATTLLWHLYDYIYNNTKIRYIMWDDCSDNFRVSRKNIYIKVGAQYVEKNGPEMIWRIRTKKVREKRDKYNLKDYTIYKATWHSGSALGS